MTYRLLLADDHQLFLEGLRALVEPEPELEVVDQVGDGREALAAATRLRPDLVVMDLAMPGLNGIEATRRITAELAGVRVLALSMHPEARFVEAALDAGAVGYLLKSCVFEELLRAIRTVLTGRTYLSPSISDVVVESLRRRPRPGGAFALLSDREREVLQLLAEGHSTKQVASLLSLSPKTIHSHRERVMEKLGIDNLAGLIRYALREGLSPTDEDPVAPLGA